MVLTLLKHAVYCTVHSQYRSRSWLRPGEGVLVHVAEYIAYVASEGDKFATAAGQGSLSVDVPACDGWDMRALVRHLGVIHLWAAANIRVPVGRPAAGRRSRGAPLHRPELASAWPDDAELIWWYRRTNENLIRVLESVPADHECWTFLPAPTAITMWARARRARSPSIDSTPRRHAGAPRTSSRTSPRTCSTNSCRGLPPEHGTSPWTASACFTSSHTM